MFHFVKIKKGIVPEREFIIQEIFIRHNFVSDVVVETAVTFSTGFLVLWTEKVT